MTLKAKILFAFLAVTLFSIFCLGYLASYTAEAALKKEAYAFLSAINQQKTARLNQWISSASHQLEILASMPVFNATFFSHINSYNKQSIFHDDLYHQNIISRHFMPSLQSLVFREVFVIRLRDGETVMSTDARQEGKLMATRPFFIGGKTGTHVENAFFSMSIRQPTMVISTPLRDRNSETQAVLAGRLNLEQLSAIMKQRTDLKQTEDTFLVNPQNYFITEPRYGENYALLKTVHNSAVEAALKHKSGISQYNDYRGIPVIGAYMYIAERNLAIITEIDQNEFLRPVKEMRRNILFVAMFACIVALIFASITTEMLYSPLRKLISAVQEINSENLQFKNPLPSRDEIGRLADAFEKLTLHLQSTLVSRDILREEIEERKKIQDRLKEALAEVGRSNQELEQFAYVASHDLQEPLRMVSSYTQLLADRYRDQLDERGLRFINYAVDGALKMQVLIQDLLTFSRINTRGKDFTVVDTNRILEQVITLLKVLIHDAKAVITYDNMPIVLGDDTQIRQVFQNLITNAIKYCREKQPFVHITSKRDNGYQRFMVEDNGIGIEEKYADRIFIIFQRLHTSDEYSGTGIGLALCKRIIERHGGKIWLESDPERGTRFFFTLKAVENEMGHSC